MVVIKGHFDGKVLVPDEPVDLPQDTPLVFHVELPSSATPPPASQLLQVLEKYAGSIEAPTDWSAEHDHYLYGTQKRSERDGQ